MLRKVRGFFFVLGGGIRGAAAESMFLSCPGQGRGPAAGLPGAGGGAGESGGPLFFLRRGPDRQTLLQHEGVPSDLLELL